jgi:hypothetical protein
MLNKLTGLLKDGESLSFFLFLLYVLALLHLMAFVVVAWCWKSLP